VIVDHGAVQSARALRPNDRIFASYAEQIRDAAHRLDILRPLRPVELERTNVIGSDGASIRADLGLAAMLGTGR